MGVVRGDHPPARRPPRPERVGGVARRDEPGEVAGGAARDERASRSLRHPGQLAEPCQGLVLRVNGPGALRPAAPHDGGGSDEDVEQHRRLRRRPRDERREQRMIDRDRRRRQMLGEDAERLHPSDAVLGDGLADLAPKLLGRPRAVQGRGAHADAVDGVVDDRLCPGVHRLGVLVHPRR